MLSRVLGRGKQIEIGKSNFSSKVHSTGIRNYILQSQELRIGVKARSVNKKSSGELGVRVGNHEVEARHTERM